jgi:acyl carrier protein
MATDARAVPDTAEIERRVLEYLQRELLGPGVTTDRHTGLLSGEVLDSMSVLRLAAFVGESFQIAIQPSDFVVEHFRTVAAIAEYVRRTLADRVPKSSET